MKRFTKDIIVEHIETNTDNTVSDTVLKPNGFCLLKPGFVDGKEDLFCDILNKNGWKIINKKRVRLTPDQASTLYVNLEDKPFYGELCDYMSSDDCLCCSCVNERSTDPIGDMNKIKECVREMWGKDDMRNAMHSSDSEDNVKREYALCFGKDVKEDCEDCACGADGNMSDKLIRNFTINNDRFKDNQFNTSAANDYICGLIPKLQKAIAEEVEASYFYMMTKYFLKGNESTTLQQLWDSYQIEEMQCHARELFSRLNEIGSTGGELFDFKCIDTLAVSNGHGWTFNGDMDTLNVLQTAINMEANSIETYKDLEVYTRGIDTITNDLIKNMLKEEVKHLTSLRDVEKSFVQMTFQNL